MSFGTEPSIAIRMAAALDWWRDAGIDCDFSDSPRDWLAESTPPPAAPPARVTPAREAAPRPPLAPQAPVASFPAQLPEDHAAFVAWWLAEPSLDGGQLAGRVPPRGPLGADVMVLVPEPEAGDADRLLAGPQGRLLDAMLGAMGIAPESTYVASVLPRHTPAADWAELAAQGLGAVLARHIALAAPRRLMAFGGNILPLLGHAPPNSADILHQFNHEGLSVPLLAGYELGALLQRPRTRAAFWRRWLDWSA